VGHLLRFFLEQQGVQVNGRIRMGPMQPQQDKLVYRYQSRFNIEQVIARMLEYSNNFIANQILIAAGTMAYSTPGTLGKGVQAAKDYAQQQLAIESLQIVEGSGISRKNRVSAAELVRVLESFEPHHSLMRHEDGLFYKTGTLRGIHTRVGYIDKKGGQRYRFVVLVNTPGKSIEPIIQQMLDSLP
jgi:D-alanyl-D-alanine carboxypeptidase/D-alanyl-D-alanine-endopeptidase (penicillin-binding protein 4)